MHVAKPKHPRHLSLFFSLFLSLSVFEHVSAERSAWYGPSKDDVPESHKDCLGKKECSGFSAGNYAQEPGPDGRTGLAGNVGSALREEGSKETGQLEETTAGHRPERGKYRRDAGAGSEVSAPVQRP